MTADALQPTAAGRSAEVELDGRTATASVVASTDALPRSAGAAVTARAWLLLALSADDAGDPQTAATAARRGLDELGDDHHEPGDPAVDDDTPLKIHAAGTTDDDEVRAALLVRALESRLVMFGWRHEAVGLVFDPPVGDPDQDDDEQDVRRTRTLHTAQDSDISRDSGTARDTTG